MHFLMAMQDQYGNYVIQHVLKHGRPSDRGRLMREVSRGPQHFVSGQIAKISRQW